MSKGLSGWRECKLGDISVKIGSGATPTGGSNAYKPSGISLIRSQNILDFKFSNSGLAFIDEVQAYELRNVSVEENDVLLNITGDSVARCCIVPKTVLPARVNQHVAIIRLNDRAASYSFIYYLLQAKKEDLLMQSEIGATRKALTKGMIEELEILIPALPEQKAIANLLSSLDDKIDLLHRQNKTLESMAETLFRQWFIEEAQEEWAEFSVSDFADHIKENVVPAKSKSEYYHHYSLPAFDEGKRPTLELGSEILSNKYKVIEHSILVSKLNPKMPRIWPVSSLPSNRVRILSVLQVLTPKNIRLYGYLLFLLRSNDAVDALSMAASGTSGSHQRVRPEDIFNIKTRLPSLARAEQYSDMVMPGIAKTATNLVQIETLEKLRDTMLPKLMSGNVRIKN